jgi:hypothetical protein
MIYRIFSLVSFSVAAVFVVLTLVLAGERVLLPIWITIVVVVATTAAGIAFRGKYREANGRREEDASGR